MIQLTIHVDLLPDKLNEFNQSWEFFIQHTKNSKDLSSYSMKTDGPSECNIKLNCASRKQLNLFMKGEWYEFLMGAIQTLSNTIETKQIQLDN